MQIFRINAASGAASLVIFKCIEKSCLDPWICIKTPSSSAEMSFTSNAIVFAVLQKTKTCCNRSKLLCKADAVPHLMHSSSISQQTQQLSEENAEGKNRKKLLLLLL